MADLLSNSALFFNSKPFLPLPALSRTIQAGSCSSNCRRRTRKLPQISFFCRPDSQVVVEIISTHEHDDGSFLFQFGDPSELAEEGLLVESKVEKVDGRKDMEDSNVVDGDWDKDEEHEEMLKRVERNDDILTYAANDTNLSDSVVETSERSNSHLHIDRSMEADEPLLENSGDHFAHLDHNTGQFSGNPSPNMLLEVELTEDVDWTEPNNSIDAIQTPEFVLSSGAASLPHPAKVDKRSTQNITPGGVDAYFMTNQNWLGLADGIGQWSLEGTVPGVYSIELMRYCEKAVLQNLATDPKAVLELSIEKVESPGSSTALIVHFDGRVLHVANIGDSGFMIIRNGVVYKMSSPMLHEFSFPILIGRDCDPSRIVQEYKSELEEGDVVVTATDGLFDNLYPQEITSIVASSLEANKTPQQIAEALGTRAQEVGGAGSGRKRSPFSDAAEAAGYIGQTGGRRDSVAVIVCLVQNAY
ncbi:unnamed protein product [Cuscuta campestris]|uniref:Protein phosphatase n=1 Tax=Cuscuta campestris TaxID=132261 RepID=A0A484MLA5_9ASTE|nr:unnamed protein product [Cuscuta campestris]